MYSLTNMTPASEIEKLKVHKIIGMIEYVPDSIIVKTILKKPTGGVSIISVDDGKGLTGQTSPFDAFVQVIDGMVALFIKEELYLLQTGESIVIPAHSPNHIKPGGRFQMILTVIKSGYE